MTVQRWERRGLPIHRLPNAKKGAVFAYAGELEEWMKSAGRQTSPHEEAEEGVLDTVLEDSPLSYEAPPPQPAPTLQRSPSPSKTLFGALGVLGIAVAAAAIVAWRMTGGLTPQPATGLRATSPRPGVVRLTWELVPGRITHYEVAAFGKVVFRTPDARPAAEISQLDAGTSYHWDVRTCDGARCGSWHGIVGQTPDGSLPPIGAPQDPFDIVFASTRTSAKYQLWLMRAHGGGPKRLTDGPGNHRRPVWSPDRTKIAFASDASGYGEIHVLDLVTGTAANLTQLDPAIDWSPSWSPDGRRIAFVSTRSGDFDVWVMNADGSNPLNLTRSSGDDGEPSWSHNGDRIVFVSKRDGGDGDIYTMKADGSEVRRLTHDGSDNAQPAWSPDDRRIAFRSGRDGSLDIHVMYLANGDRRNLTRHPGKEEMPTWSPDGGRLAFRSNRDGNFEIYSVEPEGGGLLNLTSIRGDDSDPDWGFIPAFVGARRMMSSSGEGTVRRH